jgi:hypothetical protein
VEHSAQIKGEIPMRTFAALIVATLLASAGVRDVLAGQASSSAQSSAPAAAGLAPLALSAGTAIVAKLSTDLDAGRCKVGDAVEAEAKQDVKQGHDVLLKKGSLLVGHVAAVKSSGSELTVAFDFDSVRMKDGKQFSLPLIIQALAPEADISNNSTLSDGRGLDSTLNSSAVKHHDSTLKGSINQLDAKSTGVYDFRGMNLSDQNTNGTHYSLVTSSAGSFKLKKGSQLVMKAVGQ